MEDNRGKTDAFFQGIHASQIPIVVLDERWHQMFNVIEKPKLVKDLEDEVNALLKKQGQVNNDLKEVKKIKNKLMQEIVEQMEVSGEIGISQAQVSRLEKGALQKVKDGL